MEKQIHDIRPQKTRPSRKFWIGLAVLVVLVAGVVLAAAFNDEKVKRPERDKSAQETVQGQHETEEIEFTDDQKKIRGQDVEVSPEDVDLSGSQSDSQASSPPAREPGQQAQPSQQTAQKPAVCAEAENELAQARARAESDYKLAVAEAESIYQLELQEADAKLKEAQTRRAAAINTYNTEIDEATVKYNSSEEPDSYTVYQEEQKDALDRYNAAVTEIGNEEQIWRDQKEDAGKRKDIRIQEAEDQRTEALAKAEGQYQLKITGKNCN